MIGKMQESSDKNRETFGFLAESKNLTHEFDMTVLIPTFNERENICEMISTLNDVFIRSGIRGHVLVVDDNSRDGTIEAVKSILPSFRNVSLVVRYTNHGLSPSLYEGLLLSPTPLIQCIDCDFSHPPEKIPEFYRCLKEEDMDIVIGSRYVKGGGSVNWPLIRRILSYGASIIGRFVIPVVHDSGSGFFAINRRVLEGATLTPRGFRMGFEILGKGNWQTAKEIPFIFRNRNAGKSKLKPFIILQFLIQTVGILHYNFVLGASANIKKAWKHHFFH
ncbi:MAG: polyprenol monophosphomannose synthase [Methanolinea sp.]|nr:polyprenol monophosphomannose synthase [Methanolinea sp.]